MSAWWQALLRRIPVKEASPVLDVLRAGMAPPPTRAGWGYVMEPSGAPGVFSGLIYQPPPGGGVVRAIAWGGALDTAAAAQFGVVDPSVLITLSTTSVADRLVNVHRALPLRGAIIGAHFDVIGELARADAARTPFAGWWPVHPPNWFVLLLTSAAAQFEGAVYVEEYVDDSTLTT